MEPSCLVQEAGCASLQQEFAPVLGPTLEWLASIVPRITSAFEAAGEGLSIIIVG